jgi:hypothetical protein
MRTLIIGLAAASLIAGTASAQPTHRLIPGSNQIQAPSTALPGSSDIPTPPPPTSGGLQSGQVGKAGGSHDFPRRLPDPGSVPNSANDGANKSPVNARQREYPMSWKGSPSQWSSHAQACAAKYKGYNASTDLYAQADGAQAMCPANLR